MPLTNAQHQAAARTRRTAKLAAMEQALREVRRRMGADTSDWARGILAVVSEGLGE